MDASEVSGSVLKPTGIMGVNLPNNGCREFALSILSEILCNSLQTKGIFKERRESLLNQGDIDGDTYTTRQEIGK